MKNIVEIYKALSDETRLRMMRLLLDARTELCCCEFADVLEVSQYNVSRHLKILERAGLIESRKEGRWVYFALSPGKNPLKQFVLKSVENIPAARFKKDGTELKKRLKIRVRGKCLAGIQKKHLRT